MKSKWKKIGTAIVALVMLFLFVALPFFIIPILGVTDTDSERFWSWVFIIAFAVCFVGVWIWSRFDKDDK